MLAFAAELCYNTYVCVQIPVRRTSDDMKKFYISLAAVIAAAFAVIFIGSALEWWSVSSQAEGLLGLLAIVPAAVWIFFKGLNLVNVGIYLAGIDYILVKKFLSLGMSVALIVCEAVLLIVWIIVKNSKQAAEKAENNENTETEDQGGTNG